MSFPAIFSKLPIFQVFQDLSELLREKFHHEEKGKLEKLEKEIAACENIKVQAETISRLVKQSKDYDVSQKSLGVGINGKVLECYRKKDKGKFALKVCVFLVFFYLRHSSVVDSALAFRAGGQGSIPTRCCDSLG